MATNNVNITEGSTKIITITTPGPPGPPLAHVSQSDNLMTINQAVTTQDNHLTAGGITSSGDIILHSLANEANLRTRSLIGSTSTRMIRRTGLISPDIIIGEEGGGGFQPSNHVIITGSSAKMRAGAIEILGTNGNVDITHYQSTNKNIRVTNSETQFGHDVSVTGVMSASGYVYGDRYYVQDQVLSFYTSDILNLGYNTNSEIRIGKGSNSTISIQGKLDTKGPITASGNGGIAISASGDVKQNNALVEGDLVFQQNGATQQHIRFTQTPDQIYFDGNDIVIARNDTDSYVFKTDEFRYTNMGL